MATQSIYSIQPGIPMELARDFHEKKRGPKAGSKYYEAFSAMYDTFSEKIYRYISYRVIDETVAEDLTSLVFTKAWESLADYEPAGAQFITWLFTIAHNAIIDHYRSRKDTVTLESNPDLASDGLSPEEASISHFESDRLQKALRKLTIAQKDVVVLRFIDGMTTEEIASKLGKRTGTVRALQMRALQSLSKLMRVNG